jgi:hypothetical protein
MVPVDEYSAVMRCDIKVDISGRLGSRAGV